MKVFSPAAASCAADMSVDATSNNIVTNAICSTGSLSHLYFLDQRCRYRQNSVNAPVRSFRPPDPAKRSASERRASSGGCQSTGRDTARPASCKPAERQIGSLYDTHDMHRDLPVS